MKKFWNTVKKNYNYFLEQYKKDGKNLPNRITEFRLLSSLVVGLLLIFSKNSRFLQWIVFVVFTLVVATDSIDGYLARRLNKVTDFGKMFDPTVDKILMLAILTPIFFIYKDLQLLILVIIASEIVVGLINVVKKIPVNKLGKLRMIVQCFALTFLLLPVDNLFALKKIFIIISMIIDIVSMISYIIKTLKAK